MSTTNRKTPAFSLKKMQYHVQACVRIRARRPDSQGSINLTCNLGRSLEGKKGRGTASGVVVLEALALSPNMNRGKVDFTWSKGQVKL